MKFHYDLRLVYRTWQKWVMSERKEMPDLQKVSLVDQDAEDDVWMMDYVIRYIKDSQSSAGRGSSDNNDDLGGEEGVPHGI
jgi:hypothetical protein